VACYRENFTDVYSVKTYFSRSHALFKIVLPLVESWIV
jgi:hypothetical protein